MLQIAVCKDEQADRDNLIGILKPLLDKYIDYERQREKYGMSIEVLHDAIKHIRSIEELYRAGVTDKAMEYTKQIGHFKAPCAGGIF